MPRPIDLGPEGRAGADGISQTLTGVFGGPFDGGSEADAGHFLEQIDALLKAVSNVPARVVTRSRASVRSRVVNRAS